MCGSLYARSQGKYYMLCYIFVTICKYFSIGYPYYQVIY